MSFLDAARAARKDARVEQKQRQSERESTGRQIIARHFPILEEELYFDLRRKAMSAYKDHGALSDLDYHKRWTISMDFQQYDSNVVESHIKQCMESAFLRFVHGVNAEDRLVEYHKPGRYGGQFITGYRIIAFSYSPSTRDDYDSSPYPGQFEVTLYSRFTPSLT